MLSDEERQAIEELKNKKADYFMISNLTGKTLLNLIEKKSKEIEELKEENKKYIVQLTDEQYRKLVVTIRGEISKEWKDKIKAKIEYNKTFNDDIHKYTTLTLEELLEKE